jgi:1-deoxy-D-xylulose-5-phosphate reductoisomerase
MKLPIQYAMAYPKRLANDFPRFNFMDYPSLTFEKPDLESFRNLQLAYDAMEKGGNMPCILNASNEVVVDAFLKDKIGFLAMSDLIESVMAKATFIAKPSLEDYFESDREARELTNDLIK